VVKFLTEEWISALDHEARAQPTGITEPFIVEYRVQLEGPEPFVYHIRFNDGAINVRTGRAATPTVVLSTDRDTAHGVAANTLSAQAAFMAGRLRLDGDTMALVRNHDALAKLDAVFASVRTVTEY
jgi:putative sterol carrier protein